MPLELRLLLIVGAVLTMLYFLQCIRKSRMQIDYAIFWSLFCGLLVLMSLFPQVITWLSEQFGFHSPANMVYLIIIFVLLFKQFTMTIKLSKMDERITALAQHIALQENNTDDKKR
ncbi:DUF2304 domain-containing protein [Pygmaiobacter massiliensis]|uniref:DUF2304 domain-containing protein n=1 Tax=Pygmaiobacter massiliensis TaxID=1917873 RepID=UPI0028A029D2|nr:DUF2304 domain-containing protein [Pygmaiobacter massiliensis]